MKDKIMKSTNFEFLRSEWNELADLGAFAEHYISTDPQSSLVKSRLLAERIAMLTCKSLKLQISKDGLLSMLKELEYHGFVEKSVLNYFHLVRKAGNTGAHVTEITSNTLDIVKASFNIARWWYIVNKNTKDGLPADFIEITANHSLSKKDDEKQLKKLELLNAKLIKENEELRRKKVLLTNEESESFKIRSIASAESLNFSEEETRKYLIDTSLICAGWNVNDSDHVALEVKLLEQGTYSGKGYADYVLYDDDGTALAVVEAKRANISPEKGRAQAQDYASALQKLNKNNERPLIILTNGYESILLDDQGGPVNLNVKGYPDRIIFGIPSKESLQYRVKFQQKEMQDPASLILRPDIAGRPYQLEAIKAVAERFGEERRRKALVVQATGTGKTRVAIAITELLMRANFAKRVLFLCDRKELRRQARNAFISFMPDRRVEVLKKTKEADVEITIATYPAMMKRFQNYDIAHFDLIIADESHRSIYNKFRDLFIYFDAYQLGLTATPRNAISHDTYGMFDCKEGDPTYYYEYEKAVKEKHLVDFKPISVTTKFLREGIDSGNLTAEEIKQLERDGFDVEDIITDGEDINSKTYIKGTNQEILRNLMENGLQDASQNGPGKSIIFARNIKHASLLQEWFREMYPEYGPDYCALIHSDEARSEALLDKFKTPFANPMIAISVDMLDTGIDVPEVLNLVFAKPVKSWVKFWQMIGRGTRLCENLILDEEGNLANKKEFYIFDHYGNFEYFENATSYEESNYCPSILEKIFEARIALSESSLAHHNKESFDRTIALVKAMINALPVKSLPVQEKLRLRNQVLLDNVLEQFAPETVRVMRHELMPLMRFVPIENRKAYNFDLLMTEIQLEVLNKTSRLEDLLDKLTNSLNSLQNNISAVQAQFENIEELLSDDFWEAEQKLLLANIEEKRIKLRGIMQYSIDTIRTPFSSKVVNLDDKDVVVKHLNPVRPNSDQMNEYKLRVRAVLEPFFQSNPILLKLRKGAKLEEKDFETLLSLILTQNPDVNLKHLKEFYPNFEDLEKEMRTIVGLDGKTVKARFAEFYSTYHNLTSKQMAFMNALQQHIENYGAIQMQTLYKSPFTNFHPNGPDGIFNNEKQLQDFFKVIRTFNHNVQAQL